MGDRAVVLPETDEPEEASVGVPVEARAGAVRSSDRETECSDSADPLGRSVRKRLPRNGFGWRWGDDALCIQLPSNSPARPRVSDETEWRAVALESEGVEPFPPGPAPRPERREAGGNGLRQVAGKRLSGGAPSWSQDTRRIRPGVRSRVASSNDPSSFEATPRVTGRFEPGRRHGGRVRSLGLAARGPVRFGGDGGARQGPPRSVGATIVGRPPSEAERATRNTSWNRPDTGPGRIDGFAAQWKLNDGRLAGRAGRGVFPPTP